MFAPVFLPLHLHYCPQSNSRLHINLILPSHVSSHLAPAAFIHFRQVFVLYLLCSNPWFNPSQNCVAWIYRVHLPTFLDFILSILFCLYFLDSLLPWSVIGFMYLPTSFLSTPLVFCISYNPCCNTRHLDPPQSPSLSLCFAPALTFRSSVTPTTWLHGYLSRSQAWLYTSNL
jgi:hypothetical protein